MAFKSFTHCVQPDDYKDINLAPEAILAVLALLSPENPLALAQLDLAAMTALRAVLDYMLNGKLICLGGDRCAVGTIVSLETIEEKSFPDSIDNDFSFNLMLWPSTIADFVHPSPTPQDQWTASVGIATDVRNPQAVLVTRDPQFTNKQKGREANDISEYVGPYKATIDSSRISQLGYDGSNTPASIDVPVLHCECEGSRIHDMLEALDDIGSLGLGSDVCGWSPFGVPVGAVACGIVDVLLTPIALAALVYAWFNADDGSLDDPRTDPTGKDIGGEIGATDMVLVIGRWSYDAGHTGWNELHPVKTLVKIDPASAPDDPALASPDDFDDLRNPNDLDFARRWCALASEAPSSSSSALTSRQQAVADAQADPANQWTYHPAVDGCAGSKAAGPPTHPARG